MTFTPTDTTAETAAVDQRTIVVLDTSVLVADPEVAFSIADADVVIPLTVIEELDGLKTRPADVGYAAREALRRLESLRATAGGDLTEPVQAGDGATVRVEMNGIHHAAVDVAGLDVGKADNRILSAAVSIRDDGSPVRLLSNDAALRIKAAQFGVDAAEWVRPTNRGVATPATVEKLFTSRDLIDELYDDGSVDVADVDDGRVWYANHGVVLSDGGSSSAVCRVGANGRKLHVLKGQSEQVWGVTSRNKEQRVALDLLLDPDVSIVALTGPAGTGKTLLALAAGLHQTVEAREFRSVGVYRPVVPVGRQDLGFLPGDLDEKLAVWMEAVSDTMDALSGGDEKVAERMTAELMERRQLHFGSIAHLRGRSLANQFLLVDEVQNLERNVALTVLTRLSQGSKIVLAGDLRQIDSPYLSPENNALRAIIDAFTGQRCFGHVELTQGERSPIAALAAELLA